MTAPNSHWQPQVTTAVTGGRRQSFWLQSLPRAKVCSDPLFLHNFLPSPPFAACWPQNDTTGRVCAQGHAHGPAGAGHGRRRNALKPGLCRRVAPVLTRFAVGPCPMGSVPCHSRLVLRSAPSRFTWPVHLRRVHSELRGEDCRKPRHLLLRTLLGSLERLECCSVRQCCHIIHSNQTTLENQLRATRFGHPKNNGTGCTRTTCSRIR